jgi:branched-chain amino acid transport system substrate-binding protein
MKKGMLNRSMLTALAGLLAASVAWAQPGVSKDEIVLGSIQDLSGPMAGGSKHVRDGMLMRVEEINQQGGIHGRKIKLIVEDNGYDPRKAMLAMQKLVTRDEVFAVLGHIGTVTNMAAMPIQLENNVINFFPLSGARPMFEPADKLKMAWMVPYFDQMAASVPYVVEQTGARKVGIIYQDDEFGLEIMRGAEAGLKSINMDFAEKTSYKRGATDFASQVAKLKAAGCDMVVLGATIREAVGSMATAHKMGFKPAFVGTLAVFHHLVPVLGKGATEGLYAAAQVNYPYADDKDVVGKWAARYKTKFGEDASAWAAAGYGIVDAFAWAAQKAGPGLTTDSFNTAMESNVFPGTIFGDGDCRISATKRLCSDATGVAQIQQGRWVTVAKNVSAR